MAELPPDIIFSDILPRLPAKSLSRFKCVSKQWLSFLRTPEFLQMHKLHVIISNQNDLNILFLPTARPWVFRTIDCETPQNGFTASRPFPFEVGPGQKISFVTSLHGMVCVGIVKRYGGEYADFILWNPVTGDHKTLCKAGLHDEYCYKRYLARFGLYYSFSEDDYKLVCLTGTNFYVYSLKSNSWSDVESVGTVSYDLIMSSVLLNEKLHSIRELYSSSNKLHLMRNGNWVMYSRHFEYVYVLDTKKQTKGIMRHISYAFHPEGKYMETLVSPNQYMN